MMKPLSLDQQQEMQDVLSEYHRLVQLAQDSLRTENLRARANWFLFFEAQDQIGTIVRRIREINGY